jgi:phosphate starvation-inducible PhoH-like protein
MFGDKNQNLDSLKTNYPKLKLILRDEELKIIGDDKNVKIFLESWSMIENHYSNFGSLSAMVLKSIIKKKNTI